MSVRSVRLAFLSLLAIALSLPAFGQTVRLHTVGKGSSSGQVVSFDGQGQPQSSPTSAYPAGLTLIWQFPDPDGSRPPIGLQSSPSFRWAFAGDSSGKDVTFSQSALAALSSGGILDPAAGVPTTATIDTVPSVGGRRLAIFESVTKRSLSILEFEKGTGGGPLAVNTFALQANVSLPTNTSSLSGIGFGCDGSGSNCHVVVGDAASTYVFGYDAAAAAGGNRIPTVANVVANPANVSFLSAGPAGGAGTGFWVVGISGAAGGSRTAAVYYLDLAATPPVFVSTPVVSGLSLGSTDALVPLFDPYDHGRIALYVVKSGSTPVYVLSGLTSSPASLPDPNSNPGIDFSTSLQLPPATIVPTPDGKSTGFLVGRSGGATQDVLFRMDLATGVLSSTGILLGAERHLTLVPELPEAGPHSISADTPNVSGGDTAIFTVNRTGPTPASDVDVALDSPDGAQAGVDWTVPSPSRVHFGTGDTSAKLHVPTLAISGCKDSRRLRATPSGVPVSGVPATVSIGASHDCSLTLTPPASPVAPGEEMEFTLTRDGNDRSGPYTVPFVVTPGANATAGDFTVPSPASVPIPASSSSAELSIFLTPNSEACRPAKQIVVTTSRTAGGQATSEGTIAGSATGNCAPEASFVGNVGGSPYLPGDVVTLTVADDPTGLLDVSLTKWSVTDTSGTFAVDYEFNDDTGHAAGQVTGKTAKLRPLSPSPIDGRLQITWAVPRKDGSGVVTGGPKALGPVGDYRTLVRLDGPRQVSASDPATRRYSLRWVGARWGGDHVPAGRDSNWAESKGIRWKVDGTVVESCNGRTECAVARPSAVATVVAEAMSGADTWTGLGAPLTVKPIPAVGAGTASRTLYVPVAMEGAGRFDAFYEAELTLVNRGSAPARVDITFGNSTTAHTEYVGAGMQAVIPDLVERMRDTTANLDGAHPVKAVFSGIGASDEVAVIARMTSWSKPDPVVRAPGRAGLCYRGLAENELFGDPEGSPERNRTAYLIGLRGQTSGTTDRSNFFVVNPGTTDVTVKVSLHGSAGGTALTVQDDFTIPPGGVQSFADDQGREVAYGTVEWKSGGAFTCYATPIDNLANDGSFVFPQPVDGVDVGEGSPLVVPVVLEVPGGNGPNKYQSDLAIAAPTIPGGVSYRADYYYGVVGQEPGATLSTYESPSALTGQKILGGESQTSSNAGVLQFLRESGVLPPKAPNTSYAGVMLVTPTTPSTGVTTSDLIAGTRVDSPNQVNASHGRYGIYLPAVPMATLAHAEELHVFGLRQDEGNRSHLAIVNPGATELRVDIRLVDGDTGNEVASPETCRILAAHKWCQINYVLDGKNPPVTNGYAIISRQTGYDGPVFAYGVINDNVTNDGAYLAPLIRSCSSLGLGLSPSTPRTGDRVVLPAQVLARPLAADAISFRASPTNLSFGYVWTASGQGETLPPGLSLDTAGAVNGTPAATGSYAFTVSATEQSMGCVVSEKYLLEIVGLNFTDIGGDGQQTKVGTAFPLPLTVRLVTGASPPVAVPGVEVTFTAPGTGASCTFGGGVNPTVAKVTTDVQGRASVNATANGTVGGPYGVRVSTPEVQEVTIRLGNCPQTGPCGEGPNRPHDEVRIEVEPGSGRPVR